MSGADLARVAHVGRLLVALDFDGTLSPRVDDPLTARMLPAARAAVDALLDTPDTVVALVSGRTMHDLRLIAEHPDDSPIWLAGSHGAEFWVPGSGLEPADDDPADLVLRERLQADAERATAGLAGVWIEPKAFGLGVHTRRADAETAERAQSLIDDLVGGAAPGWRRRQGFDIVEFSFRHEGKDTAVDELRARTAADAVVFAGDDVTDEDALAHLGAADLGVHVGESPTAASVSVPDIPALAALLTRLARMRAAGRE